MGFVARRALKGLAFAFFAAIGVAGPARGAAYTILDLGTLGGRSSETLGNNVLNAHGQVVGDSYVTGNMEIHAFRTAANGPIVQGAGGSDLGTFGGTRSYAEGINASGQAVGFSYTTGNLDLHAFRTAANGALVQGAGGSDLGTLGGKRSEAFGINASGQTVGVSDTTGDAAEHAFRTTATGLIVPGAGGSDLGTLGGLTARAFGINASGQVVGVAFLAGEVNYHAFRTAANGPIVQGAGGSDLGTLGGTRSTAYGINDSGQTVGVSNLIGDAANHAFRTTGSGGINVASDLSTLGGTSSQAFGINALGQVVGGSQTTGNAATHAFFADVAGAMVDLNTLIDPASGWVLTQAHGINDSGQIAGKGTLGGQGHAFLLTPTPEPASLSLLTLVGMALFRRNRR